MARSIETDPFHCFRFAPRIGFDGKAIGMSKVTIEPGVPWQGRGEVELEAMLKSDMIEFAKINEPFSLVVGVYHITDDYGPDGDPSVSLVLTNVTPAQGKMVITPLDAASDEIFLVTLRVDYDRLTFIFGRSDESVLDRIASVI